VLHSLTDTAPPSPWWRWRNTHTRPVDGSAPGRSSAPRLPGAGLACTSTAQPLERRRRRRESAVLSWRPRSPTVTSASLLSTGGSRAGGAPRWCVPRAKRCARGRHFRKIFGGAIACRAAGGAALYALEPTGRPRWRTTPMPASARRRWPRGGRARWPRRALAGANRRRGRALR